MKPNLSDAASTIKMFVLFSNKSASIFAYLANILAFADIPFSTGVGFCSRASDHPVIKSQ